MKRPIRVLHVFTILNRGGAESMVMNYYRNIDREQVQFDFLVHREEIGVFEEEIIKLGGNIYRLPAINPLSPKKYYYELNQFLDLHPYKIIHSHINTFSFYPLKGARNRNIPLRIAHAHTTTQSLTASFMLSRPTEALKVLFKGLNKYAVKKQATHLFSCGKKAGDWLFGNTPYTIIPNAIDVSKYVYSQERDLVGRKQFNLENQFVVGHIGNFTHPKNYPFMLQVFKKIKDLHSNSKLVLVGGGPMEAEVKALAQSLDIFDDILFLGIRKDIPDILQMMDVFIFPSHYEGLPVTLIEAQAAGLKILASNTISEEVAVTDDITFLALTEPDELWAYQILRGFPYVRQDNSEQLKRKGYDVATSAQSLEQFYLNNYSEHER
ncbi:glycosyltransferase family 1 protein [Sphingobacterium faecium]|uniref:glycosyltransferase family 1 protein n=1 Tax=Sphingobacterium faecium TaxID=34087 RepID=UPI0024692F69|nr:glycosyltransferase family 1 protein [Sphingobacterium faecium]MDH5828699.1 glycosyltransferase family 1 protein [Sphingobacterium faecium]